MPTMAWRCRPDGFVEFLNQRWFRLYRPLSRRGSWLGLSAAVHPDDRGALIDRWRTLRASGQGGQVEVRLRRADGEYRWFLFRENRCVTVMAESLIME